MHFMISIKTILRKTFLYTLWRVWKGYRRNKKVTAAQQQAVLEWERNGNPLPPPQLAKRLVIKRYAMENNIQMFVETGTSAWSNK